MAIYPNIKIQRMMYSKNGMKCWNTLIVLIFDLDCYEEYRREYRFDTQIIRETDRYARTRRDCERACDNARFNCLGFAFGDRIGSSGSRDQCELTDQDPRLAN